MSAVAEVLIRAGLTLLALLLLTSFVGFHPTAAQWVAGGALAFVIAAMFVFVGDK